MRPFGLFLVFLHSAISAQPTITEPDLPGQGQILIQYSVNGVSIPQTPGSSEPQEWDHSTLNGMNLPQYDLFFTSPGVATGSSSFPDATFATYFNYQDVTQSEFYKISPLGYEHIGTYRSTEYATYWTTRTDNVLIPIPFTYGIELPVLYRETQIDDTGLGGPFYTISWVTAHISGDSYGTMRTPTWPDGVEVVRLKYELISRIDSFFVVGGPNGEWEFTGSNLGEINTVQYHYLRSGLPCYVMSVHGNGNGALYYGSSAFIGIGELGKRPFDHPYPDPANDFINFHEIEPGTFIQIMDASGRSILRDQVRGTNKRIILTGLNDGIYLYRIVDREGGLRSAGRFVIAR